MSAIGESIAVLLSECSGDARWLSLMLCDMSKLCFPHRVVRLQMHLLSIMAVPVFDVPVGCVLLFYILPTFKVSGWVPTCDSAQSWLLYSAAPLGEQTATTMT